MKRRLSHAAVALVTALLWGGCYSTLSEHRTFIAENKSQRDLSLVRVTVEGGAIMADMKFRAGYRAATAVDEVLKGDTTPITVQGEEPSAESLNKNAVENTGILLARLKEAYQNNEPREKKEEIENEIVRARSAPRVIRARETSLVPEAPAEKFIIAFSADPSKVFKAIADTTARNESEGAIYKSLRDVEQAARTRASEELAQRTSEQAATQATLEVTWRALLGEIRNRLPAESGDATSGNYEQFRAELRNYQSLLENFLAVRP